MRTALITFAGILVVLFLIGRTEWFQRNYCSDEAVCYKYMCEDGLDNGSCELWDEHCRENPIDTYCDVHRGP